MAANRKSPSSKNIAAFLIKALEDQGVLDITSVETYAYPKDEKETTYVFQVDRDIPMPDGRTARRTWHVTVAVQGTEIIEAVKP
jgi:hypothetical protein